MTTSFLVKNEGIESVPPGQLYGRRRARPLRPGQRRLREELLPRLAIGLPAAGPPDHRSLFPMPVRDVWLDICFRAGEHLAELAEHHTVIGCICCEVFVDAIVQ